MVMEPPFIILKSTSWLPSAEKDSLLGAAVKNFWAPTDNSVPAEPLEYNRGRRFVEKGFSDFVVTNKDGVGAAAGVKLQGLANLTWKGKVDDKFDLRGKRIHYIKLRQLEKFWNDLKEDPEFKATVPGWLGSPWALKSKTPVCLVTGLFICEDVAFKSSTKGIQDREAKVTAPLGTASAAACASQGVLFPNDGTGNLEAGFTANKTRQQHVKAEDKGSSIFALQLKVISSKKFNKEALKLLDKSPDAPTHRQMGEDEEALSADDLILEDVDAEAWTAWEKGNGQPDEGDAVPETGP
ncbi:hypothetical protein MMC18_004375 [Xylographa bjoerkii]|nr:hypothetical protein [Xylographa bjoerkii]